jgi:hypothetical protein
MLQNILEYIESMNGKPVEAKDIKVGSRTKLRDLQRYRKLVDQKHPMLNGFSYNYKCEYTNGNCSPRAIIYWYGVLALDGLANAKKSDGVWLYRGCNTKSSMDASTYGDMI